MRKYQENVPHGITFIVGNNEIHTWKDWKIVPTSRPVINPPDVKTNYQDIPGSDGQLDLTEVLTGYVNYSDRIGSLEFQVENDDLWVTVYSKILNFLHGKKAQVILDDEPNFMYTGRVEINEWRSDEQNSRVILNYDLEPYKYSVISTMDDWLWDPFDFENDVITDYQNIVFSPRSDLVFWADIKHVLPELKFVSNTGSDVKIQFKDKIFTLRSGVTYKTHDIVFESGENIIHIISGSGTMSANYKHGRL